MSKYKLSRRSLNKLKGVHPDLVKIVHLAITLTDTDFGVIHGVRTQQEQDVLYAQGRTSPGKIVTWTRNSKHIHGLAVDIAVFIGSEISWDVKYYKQVSKFFKEAADQLGIKIAWGGDWKTKDWGHYELID